MSYSSIKQMKAIFDLSSDDELRRRFNAGYLTESDKRAITNNRQLFERYCAIMKDDDSSKVED